MPCGGAAHGATGAMKLMASIRRPCLACQYSRYSLFSSRLCLCSYHDSCALSLMVTNLRCLPGWLGPKNMFVGLRIHRCHDWLPCGCRICEIVFSIRVKNARLSKNELIHRPPHLLRSPQFQTTCTASNLLDLFGDSQNRSPTFTPTVISFMSRAHEVREFVVCIIDVNT